MKKNWKETTETRVFLPKCSIGETWTLLREDRNPLGPRKSIRPLSAWSARVANHYRLMPLGFEGERLRVALSTLPDVDRRDELRMVLRREIVPVLAAEGDIAKAIKEHYGLGAETVERLTESEGSKKPSPASA
ncbi:MAG: hypothetical protein IPN90_02430 [Elusimicrobia bacterium]|nr:hypothetical protein [Elusimicrobiota bacterium]